MVPRLQLCKEPGSCLGTSKIREQKSHCILAIDTWKRRVSLTCKRVAKIVL